LAKTRLLIFSVREVFSLDSTLALSGHPNNTAVARNGRIIVGIAREAGALDIVDPVSLTRTKSVPVNGRLHNVYVTLTANTPWGG
jgi:hypothetical protein